MTADIAVESATDGQGAAAAGPESGAAADRSRATGSALEAHYRFLLWLIPALSRFPRDQKFLLGDRIQGTALDVLERLIEATYSKRREESGERPGAVMMNNRAAPLLPRDAVGEGRRPMGERKERIRG